MAGIVKLYGICRVNNFNEFIKTEYEPYTSEFNRDDMVKYSDTASYQIVSNAFNDAMFYQTILVEKNTPYKVSCMVKTKEVTTQKEISSAGAQISIANTVEKSSSIKGTTDWQKLEFIFNSKDRTSIEVGFRLGGYDDNCTGTAWFSDFSIEVGTKTEDTNWKVACFIFENTEVTIQDNGLKKEVKLSMSTTDISDIRQNMGRFKTSCQELSNNQMTVEYDVITIKEPITSLTYDSVNGYYVAPENVEEIVKSYLVGKNYDHMFIAVRLGDMNHQKDILVNDWIGLGGMDYQGIGFSNIRLPNNDKSYIYKYDARINTFPEEVFIHEFLHSLERNSKEYGYTVPELHAYASYGYQDEKIVGQKKWYQAYMRKEIVTDNGEKIGLDSKIYSLKPSHEQDFEFSYPLNVFKEPQNILEEIKMILNRLVENITYTIKKEGENTVV